MDESFLEELRRGGTLDSEGDFTISGAAVRKMGAFNLPQESYWVLKLVQSAVTCEAKAIHFRQMSRQTMVSFNPGQTVPAIIFCKP